MMEKYQKTNGLNSGWQSGKIEMRKKSRKMSIEKAYEIVEVQQSCEEQSSLESRAEDLREKTNDEIFDMLSEKSKDFFENREGGSSKARCEACNACPMLQSGL